jgi:serine/threonine-protein kinase
MERFLKSRYRIGEQLSDNPFSVTYQGAFLGSNKPVIIKIYKRGTLNSQLINQMKMKVKELSLFSHPNLAKLIDGDYGWQGFYYVREYVEGKTLRQLINEGHKFSQEEAMMIIEQVGRLLENIHQKGIIHGALKPENIFLDKKGIVRVTDFIIEGEIKEAMPQKALRILSESNYLAPEELAGQKAAAATDIYSLGIILAELLGIKSTTLSIGLGGGLQRIRGESGIDQGALEKLPGYLKEIIKKATERDPLQRFSVVADLCFSLEHKQLLVRKPANEEYVMIFDSTATEYGGEEIKPESELLAEVGQKKLRWGKEKDRNWILAGLLLLALISGFVFAFLYGR